MRLDIDVFSIAKTLAQKTIECDCEHVGRTQVRAVRAAEKERAYDSFKFALLHLLYF
jgi:hypothetical protein